MKGNHAASGPNEWRQELEASGQYMGLAIAGTDRVTRASIFV